MIPKNMISLNAVSYLMDLLFAIVALILAVLVVRLVDKFIFPEIQFVQEIKKGNVAAAIFFGALLVFVAYLLGTILG